jgi:hypothetical protein
MATGGKIVNGHKICTSDLYARARNAPFWHAYELPRFPPPKTPFKTQVVVEGFWKGHICDHNAFYTGFEM